MSPLADLLHLGLPIPNDLPCRRCGTELTPGGSTCLRCGADEAEEKRLVQEASRAQERQVWLNAFSELVPRRFGWASFEAVELRLRIGLVQLAQRSLDAPRLLLIGKTGIGKTSLACAMLRAWREAHCRNPAFVSAPRLVAERARMPLGHGDPELLAKALRSPLLLLDDLGNEPHTALSPIPEVVAARHDDELPIWVTTNYEPEKLSERYGNHMARRLLEGAKILRVKEP